MDKMWSEYAMYSNMYDNNLYFKYKSLQYASQYITYRRYLYDMWQVWKSDYMLHVTYKDLLYAMPTFDVLWCILQEFVFKI